MAKKFFFSVPAGLCSLHLTNLNSSSVSVRWARARGEFDFHRVTVANASVTNTLSVPREEQGAVVTGLVEGCSYNVSAERVRGPTAGSAASLTVTTGRRYDEGVSQRPGIITCLHHSFIKFPQPLTVFFSPLPVALVSASSCAWRASHECIGTCIHTALGAGSGVCGSLPGEPATKPGKSHCVPCT